jgi:hypothetical protein
MSESPTRRFICAAAIALALPFTAIAAFAQPAADHLLVYKARTAPRLPRTYTMDLDALQPTLSALGCTLKEGAKPRQLLVPVAKTNLTPTAPSAGIGGQGLQAGYLCYKLDCRAADAGETLRLQDQFLTHEVRPTKPRRLCVPVAPAPVTTTTTTRPTTTTTVGECAGDGASCAQGERCCKGLTCCAGVPVPPGAEYCGTICPISDRNQKEGFSPIDRAEILRDVAGLDITTWSYRADPDHTRHLGPMAQDFRATFGLGGSDKSIFLVDADGVALAAIQALDAEVSALRKESASLRRKVGELEARLATPDANAPAK